jgi:hypothetical protein
MTMDKTEFLPGMWAGMAENLLNNPLLFLSTIAHIFQEIKIIFLEIFSTL